MIPPKPEPQPEAAPSVEPPSESILPKIRTFKTDASVYIKENKVTDLEMATKTYVSQKDRAENTPKINYKKTFTIAGGIAFLALAGFIGYAFIGGGLRGPEPIVQGPKLPPKFVETESETEIAFIHADSASLINAIKGELGKQFKFGTANNIRIKSGTDYLNAKTFISALAWNAPKDFADSLEPDLNLLVTYLGAGNAPVFIFKSKDFTKTFASLLEWEPDMWQDMKPFLDLSTIDVKTFYKRPFIDDTVKNNDARAFTTTDGKLLFEYAFFSKKFIIISTSREALEMIFGRLLILPPQ